MIDQVLALVVDESKWLPFSMSLAVIGVWVLWLRHRGSASSLRPMLAAVLNLFYGITIGVMAAGHLLAVSAKLAMGSLEGSLVVLYAIGIAIAVPSWWLVVHARKMPAAPDARVRRTVILNAWLGLTLFLLGLHNVPIAAPAIVNIAYSAVTHRAVGWALVGIAAAIHLFLFIGSILFLASGQSFEEFRGVG